MRLTELEPRWIHTNVFLFQCPHCKQVLLSCKNIPMAHQDQYDLFEKALGEDWHLAVVGSRPEFAWGISGDSFETLTVTPSIDASASGHWHGFITNGEITN